MTTLKNLLVTTVLFLAVSKHEQLKGGGGPGGGGGGGPGISTSVNNKLSPPSSSNGPHVGNMSKSLASFHLSSSGGHGGSGGPNGVPGPGAGGGGSANSKAMMDTSVDQVCPLTQFFSAPFSQNVIDPSSKKYFSSSVPSSNSLVSLLEGLFK